MALWNTVVGTIHSQGQILQDRDCVSQSDHLPVVVVEKREGKRRRGENVYKYTYIIIYLYIIFIILVIIILLYYNNYIIFYYITII